MALGVGLRVRVGARGTEKGIAGGKAGRGMGGWGDGGMDLGVCLIWGREGGREGAAVGFAGTTAEGGLEDSDGNRVAKNDANERGKGDT